MLQCVRLNDFLLQSTGDWKYSHEWLYTLELWSSPVYEKFLHARWRTNMNRMMVITLSALKIGRKKKEFIFAKKGKHTYFAQRMRCEYNCSKYKCYHFHRIDIIYSNNQFLKFLYCSKRKAATHEMNLICDYLKSAKGI